MENKSLLNIENVIEKNVGANKKVRKCDIINISKPGENYAGVMLGVNITIAHNGQEEIIHGVAKTPNFNVHESFKSHIAVDFKKEVAFYQHIVPILKKFYQEQGVNQMPDIFPKLYAVRYNLSEDSETVDEYAFMLLENLVEQGNIILSYTNFQ